MVSAVLASAASALEQRGVVFVPLFWAQVRFGTGAKGAGIGAIGFSYGAMEQWVLVYAQLV